MCVVFLLPIKTPSPAHCSVSCCQLLITFPALRRSAPCCPPYTSLLSAVNCRADRRTLTDTTKAHRHTNTQILFINTPKLSSISPKVFCITPKVLKNALAAFIEKHISPSVMPREMMFSCKMRSPITLRREPQQRVLQRRELPQREPRQQRPQQPLQPLPQPWQQPRQPSFQLPS